MTQTFVLSLARDTLTVALMLAAPLLAVSLVVGLGVSVFQALTQIHEMTLTFVPKLVGVAVVLLVLGAWMMQSMLEFTMRMFSGISVVGG